MISVQLSVRGNPSAFDIIYESDNLVISCPGCLSFFDLRVSNGPKCELNVPPNFFEYSGSPKHVIHYEQPQQIRKLKYKPFTSSFAALRGGILSLWDPVKTFKPVQGFLSSLGW